MQSKGRGAPMHVVRLARTGLVVRLARAALIVGAATVGLGPAPAPAHAQEAPQPLGAPGGVPPGPVQFEPVRPAPLQAPRQAVAPGRIDGAPIEVGVLTEIDPSVLGLLDDGNGGLGQQMWQGTTRARVESLLPRLPMNTASPVMQDLSRRLLLTTAAVPEGTGTAPSLLGLRVERLMAGGRIADVNELLRVAATPVSDPALHRAQIDAMLLAGDYGGACQRVPALVAADPSADWLKTLAFCRALEQDSAAVTLAIALLRDRGEGGDEAFFGLIDALAGGTGATLVTTLVDPTPLHLSMLRAANQPVPADAVDGAAPAILWAIATAPKAAANTVSVEALDAAERAEAAGALPTNVLADIYAAVEYGAAEVDAALQTAATDRGPRVNALLFQAATVWTDPEARASALQAAWKAARADGTFATAARVNLPALLQLDPIPELLGLAPDAARAALAAGDLALAWRWLDLAARQAGTITPQGANSAAIAATAQLWPLLQMADPAGAQTRSPARSRAWWQELPAASQGLETERRALLYTLFAALGEPLPALAWEPMLAGPAAVAAVMPSPAVARAMADSAAAKRVGETVLLVLLTLGEAGTEGAGGATLVPVIQALRAIGLDKDARAVAVEAALGRGL